MLKRIQIVNAECHVLDGSYKTIEQAKSVISFEPGKIEVIHISFVQAIKEYYVNDSNVSETQNYCRITQEWKN